MEMTALGLAVLAPAMPAAAEAPAGDRPVEELVVVATKSARSIRDVAADVTVLDQHELRATLSTSLADAFRYVPGVAHHAGGSRFGTEGITIRGIGGNRIAMELDGVPLSEQFDVGSFANATRDFADAGLIGQVEVLRGPASAVYGSAALGGVVSVRTPDPRSFTGPDASGGRLAAIHHGADDSLHTEGGYAIEYGGVAALVSGSYREGAEPDSAATVASPDRQDYRRKAGLFKLTGENRLGHGWELGVIRQEKAARTRIESVLGSGRFRSTTALTGDDRYRMDILSLGYGFAAPGGLIDDGTLRIFSAAAHIDQHTDDERAAAADPVLIARDFSYEQRLRGAELNLWRDAEFTGWSSRLGFGLEWTERRTEELRDATSTSLADGSVSDTVLGETFPLRDFPITQTRELGAYVSDELTRGPLTLIVALRYDDNRLAPDPDAVYLEDNPATEPVSVADADLSPKLGAIYRVGDNLDLYLQYAHGFRAPPFEDANIGLDIPLFNIRAIPNPALESETSDGWELGARWLGDRAEFSLALFHTEYRDFIETKARIGIDPVSGRLLFQSRNIGRATIRGAEARGSCALSGPLEGLTLTAAAFVARGDNRDTGLPLNAIGPAEAVVGATWRSADERTELRALLTATRAWNRRDESAGELFEPAGHAVLDLFASQRFGERMVVRAGIGNVTDRVYWRWSEVGGLAPDDPTLPMLAEAGRNYSIGLQWNW